MPYLGIFGLAQHLSFTKNDFLIIIVNFGSWLIVFTVSIIQLPSRNVLDMDLMCPILL